MQSFTGGLKVFLAIEPCDMRKGFEGLTALVAERLKEELRSGALFVFCNKTHTRLKVLYWNGSGLWLLSKRLEKGCFNWPKDLEEGAVQRQAGRLPHPQAGHLCYGLERSSSELHQGTNILDFACLGLVCFGPSALSFGLQR
jgi:transposase